MIASRGMRFREVALLLTLLIAIGVRSRIAIVFLGIAMTVVQAFDGVIGALAHNPSKTYGPFAFAVLNALAVGWLLRERASHPNEPVKSSPLLDQPRSIRRD